VDIAIASLVLMLGLRRPPGARLTWVFLGGGLVTLAVVDSVYVALGANGQSVIGTPVHAGWVVAFLLVALSTLVPSRATPDAGRPHFTVVQELLPYLPVLVAILVATSVVDNERLGDPVLFGGGLLLLVTLVVQQVLVALEKVTLAADLEATVTLRSEQLRAADERFGSLIESSDDAIIGKTVDGVVTSWNPAAERLYGYRADEIVGQSARILVPPVHQAEESSILAAGAEGGRHRYETERVRKDGVILPVSLTVSPILADGQVVGLSVIGHDITDRKRAAEALAAARDQALAGSREKSEFLATMSHEIRTPMNGVIGLTGLLLDTPLDEVQRRYATGVRGAGEALLGIIDDILDFSKLDAGKVELEQVAFDPRQLVEEVGLLMASTASGKGLEIVAYCAADMPVALRGDSGRLRQILLNLASNAVKFTAQGEVVLSVTTLPSDEAGDPTGAAVRFAVRDTGLGIDPAIHERLFQPFSQADASTTRRFGGTGLGLAICQRLVEAMGGRLDLDSTPGQGSTFSFVVTLPLCAGVSAPAILPDLLQGARVLVVDDNETNRLVLSAQLSAWGMVPDLAADARSGLVLLRAAADTGKPYPMAVLDLCMPEMDGLSLATVMAADPVLAQTSTMILTSAGPLDAAAAARAGVRRWASKPVRSSELYGALMQLAAQTTRVALPADAVSAPAAAVATIPQPRASRGSVLVVEDNEVNQLVAQGVLHKLGFTVELAADGRLALDALQAQRFDLVLMDCHMPEMDGFEATAEIRRLEGDRRRGDRRAGARRRMPVIAMTAGVLAEDQERCRAAGMDDFVAKPIDVELLEQALVRQLNRAATVQSDPAGPDVAAAVEVEPAGALDLARLDVLRRLDPEGTAGLVPAVISAFLAEVPTRMAAVQEAMAAGGGLALEQAAHQLKGSAANLGATQVAGLCGRLESLGRSGSPLDADVFHALQTELERATQALSEVLAVCT